MHLRSLVVFLLLTLGLYSDILKYKNIVGNYDGDTFKVNLLCATPIVCKDVPIRVSGVDTPEIGTVGAEDAKKFTEKYLKNKPTLSNCARDKYYRLRCDINNSNGRLDQLLISNGLGKEYHGGTR